MKKAGLVGSKDEFWYGWDMQDVNEAGPLVDGNLWEKYILKPDGKIHIGVKDYTK